MTLGSEWMGGTDGCGLLCQRIIWRCFRTKKGAENRDIMISVMGTMKIQKKTSSATEKNISSAN
jgi:hypothetical protein